jgi:histidyl-tRNA synthetase
LLAESIEGMKGRELRFMWQCCRTWIINRNFRFGCNLARGLNYYTGAIFGAPLKSVAMGSIGGGGRYDDLTGIFGLKIWVVGILV